MEENNPKTLPAFASLDEMVEFFDTQDLGDYLEQMPEAHFEVDLRSNIFYYPVEASMSAQIIQIAQHRGVSAATLVNLWLQDKLRQEAA